MVHPILDCGMAGILAFEDSISFELTRVMNEYKEWA